MEDTEKDAINTYEETMNGLNDDQRDETQRDENQRGDCAYSSKEDFGKKTVYIPCGEHRARKAFAEALLRCTEANNIESENINLQLTTVYPLINKNTVAHIVRANRLLKQFSGYDYVVEFSGVAFDNLTYEQVVIVYHHELEHLRFKEKPDGTMKHGLVKHDLEDFHSIIDKYGLHYLPSNVMDEDAN
jgi:predicted metallopeptidase